MNRLQQKLDDIRKQEEELQFATFTNEMALQLGLSIIQNAREEEKAISVEIIRNGQVLFSHAMDGTSPDQTYWMTRKANVVRRHHHSSYYMRLYNELKERSYFEAYSVSPQEYAVHGGSFPLSIQGVGVIGSITVSGLSQEEDHELAVQGIKNLIENNKK